AVELHPTLPPGVHDAERPGPAVGGQRRAPAAPRRAAPPRPRGRGALPRRPHPAYPDRTLPSPRGVRPAIRLNRRSTRDAVAGTRDTLLVSPARSLLCTAGRRRWRSTPPPRGALDAAGTPRGRRLTRARSPAP